MGGAGCAGSARLLAGRLALVAVVVVEAHDATAEGGVSGGVGKWQRGGIKSVELRYAGESKWAVEMRNGSAKFIVSVGETARPRRLEA